MSLRVARVLSPLVVVLAACGGASTTEEVADETDERPLAGLSASQVLDKAQESVAASTSVHVVAHIVNGDEFLDLDIVASEGDSMGTVTTNGRVAEIRRVGHFVYIKGDRPFWLDAANATVARRLAGHWFKGPATAKGFRKLAEVVSLESMLDGLVDEDSDVTRSHGRRVDGQPTVALHGKDKEGNGTTVLVADADGAFPLRLFTDVNNSSGIDARAEFKEWNESVDVAAPTNDVIDSAKAA
jgi:hypothetical protein